MTDEDPKEKKEVEIPEIVMVNLLLGADDPFDPDALLDATLGKQ